MLRIRLQRIGRKNSPHFRVVLTDRLNSTKSGKVLEILGSYDAKGGNFKADAERAKHWISKGAQPTDTVHNFFVDQKIVEGKKRDALPKRKAKKEGAPVSA